jgi:hypothetical protein
VYRSVPTEQGDALLAGDRAGSAPGMEGMLCKALEHAASLLEQGVADRQYVRPGGTTVVAAALQSGMVGTRGGASMALFNT